MRREEVIGKHRYFAKIDGEFVRVKTLAERNLFTKNGDVKCRRYQIDTDNSYITVKLEDLFSEISPEDYAKVKKLTEQKVKQIKQIAERKEMERREKLREERRKDIKEAGLTYSDDDDVVLREFVCKKMKMPTYEEFRQTFNGQEPTLDENYEDVEKRLFDDRFEDMFLDLNPVLWSIANWCSCAYDLDCWINDNHLDVKGPCAVKEEYNDRLHAEFKQILDVLEDRYYQGLQENL